jgi:uncharacterized hydrophobic protein (TIGR00271 family)
MSDTNQQNTPEQSSLSLKDYLKNLFDISRDTDRRGTLKDIKDGISIKGHNAWILIFSILIASVGLNVSSTAVVIGAMLISPLMGPILGLGMSIATNDVETLKRSLLNLGTMVAISLLTSFLFFSIPLFHDATPEILARTKPDLRDVLIALAGGLALIVSLSRRTEMTNVIAGVAIATALMPPLCTAGYGLAVANFDYFAGAFFLFIINSTFIALATFVILKFLNFPAQRYKGSKVKTNIARIASFIALIVFLGSIYAFYNLVKEKQFAQKVHNLEAMVKEDGYSLIDMEDHSFDYEKNAITLTIFGKQVEDDDLANWQKKLTEMGLTETELIIHQNEDDSDLVQEIQEIRKAYNTQFDLIRTKDEALEQLQKQLDYNKIPLQQIAEEARINYSDLLSVSFAREFNYNFQKMDTVIVISSVWNRKNKTAEEQYEKFGQWVKTRLEYKAIEVLDETPDSLR